MERPSIDEKFWNNQWSYAPGYKANKIYEDISITENNNLDSERCNVTPSIEQALGLPLNKTDELERCI